MANRLRSDKAIPRGSPKKVPSDPLYDERNGKLGRIIELFKLFSGVTDVTVLSVGGDGVSLLIQKGSKQYVAKIIESRLTWAKDDIDRLVHNAELLSKLDHPQIPKSGGYRTYDKDGLAFSYSVREYISGKSMAELMGMTATDQEDSVFIPLPERQVVSIMDQCLTVFEYIHDYTQNGVATIIHRDVKPHNIIMGNDGKIKLIDFGVAKIVGTKKTTTQLGTDGYSPLEQITRNPRPNSDIYALGITAIEALLGRMPREVQLNWAREGRKEQGKPIEPGEPCELTEYSELIPPGLQRILRRMIHPNADKRYQTATEVKKDLQAYTTKQDSNDSTNDTKPGPPPNSIVAYDEIRTMSWQRLLTARIKLALYFRGLIGKQSVYDVPQELAVEAAIDRLGSSMVRVVRRALSILDDIDDVKLIEHKMASANRVFYRSLERLSKTDYDLLKKGIENLTGDELESICRSLDKLKLKRLPKELLAEPNSENMLNYNRRNRVVIALDVLSHRDACVEPEVYNTKAVIQELVDFAERNRHREDYAEYGPLIFEDFKYLSVYMSSKLISKIIEFAEASDDGAIECLKYWISERGTKVDQQYAAFVCSLLRSPDDTLKSAAKKAINELCNPNTNRLDKLDKYLAGYKALSSHSLECMKERIKFFRIMINTARSRAELCGHNLAKKTVDVFSAEDGQDYDTLAVAVFLATEAKVDAPASLLLKKFDFSIMEGEEPEDELGLNLAQIMAYKTKHLKVGSENKIAALARDFFDYALENDQVEMLVGLFSEGDGCLVDGIDETRLKSGLEKIYSPILSKKVVIDDSKARKLGARIARLDENSRIRFLMPALGSESTAAFAIGGLPVLDDDVIPDLMGFVTKRGLSDTVSQNIMLILAKIAESGKNQNGHIFDAAEKIVEMIIKEGPPGERASCGFVGQLITRYSDDERMDGFFSNAITLLEVRQYEEADLITTWLERIGKMMRKRVHTEDGGRLIMTLVNMTENIFENKYYLCQPRTGTVHLCLKRLEEISEIDREKTIKLIPKTAINRWRTFHDSEIRVSAGIILSKYPSE